MTARNIVSLIAANAPQSYASQVNAKFKSNASNLVLLDQRYNDAANVIQSYNPAYFAAIKHNAIKEFQRLHANVKTWQDLQLAQSVYAKIADIFIDTTMQRELSLKWVFTLLENFEPTMVVPIQVYIDPDTGKMCAWDGQHTAILMYFICVHLLNLDPNEVEIPVNIFHSSRKAQMRNNFLTLNGSGKKTLDLIDFWIQHVFGVRIDKSTIPSWVLVEKKQTILEKYDLFATHEKFGDDDMPGAISRLQELNSVDLVTLDWLCYYLSLATQGARSVVEKEIVMMTKFFTYCKANNVKVTKDYIEEIAELNLNLFNADFSPYGPFWQQVAIAYGAWHSTQAIAAFQKPRVTKEPINGIPFLIAQYSKDLPHLPMPRTFNTNGFWPANADLF